MERARGEGTTGGLGKGGECGGGVCGDERGAGLCWGLVAGDSVVLWIWVGSVELLMHVCSGGLEILAEHASRIDKGALLQRGNGFSWRMRYEM